VTLQNPDPDKLVEVFANTDTTLVIIARDALESVEIESFIFDEHASVGMVYGFRAPMRLWYMQTQQMRHASACTISDSRNSQSALLLVVIEITDDLEPFDPGFASILHNSIRLDATVLFQRCGQLLRMRDQPYLRAR
jgi:hypothetical protein